MQVVVKGEGFECRLLNIENDVIIDLEPNKSVTVDDVVHILTISTLDNYEFVSIGYYEGGDWIEPSIIDEGHYEDGEWVEGTGEKLRSIDITLNNKGVWVSDYSISVDTLIIQPPSNVSGFNNLYLVDNDILKSMTNERFIKHTVGDEPVQIMDLGEFIINIFELPFPIPFDKIGLETRINMGTELINTTAAKILSDEIEFNLGTILVPSKFKNSFDFIDTETILHLPFIEPIKLDVGYVIDYQINVKYIVNLYTGNVTVNIYSSKTNTIIESKNFIIGRMLPYTTTQNSVIGEMKHSEGLNNGIRRMFIEVIRNVPTELNMFNVEITSYSTLKDVKGYIEVSNIQLQSSATLQEKNRIISILNSGVIIN